MHEYTFQKLGDCGDTRLSPIPIQTLIFISVVVGLFKSLGGMDIDTYSLDKNNHA